MDSHESTSEPLFDIILRGGTLIDGSGGPTVARDVAIRGDRIACIGDLGDARAHRDIDLRGLMVAPGFIDVHTHDDAALIARPSMLPKLTQGVTTVIAGNCGMSGAPFSATGDPPGLLRLVFKSARFVAATWDGFLQKVSDSQPAVNAGFLTGHTTLRMEVLGNDLNRTATAPEIREMRRLLDDCLRSGALGLSTGLFYPPARAASADEVTQVAEPLKDWGGVYVTHMRDEGDHVMESLRETLTLGRTLDVPVVISHHKCMGRRNHGRSVETLAFLHEAGREDAVALDVYPYEAGSSVLNEELAAQSSRTLVTWSDPNPSCAGRDLSAIAQEWGCSEREAIAKLMPAGAVYFLMDEQDVTRILRFPRAMVGSDGLPEDQHPHPRLWGTFPRVLGTYVRERGVLSLEEAVRRMTGLPAERFGLKERGLIRQGFYADLCVFDPSTVSDLATYEKPTEPAIGIEVVIVNGRVALDNGIPTGERAGKVLLREECTSSSARSA